MRLSQFLSLGKDLIISLWKQPIILSTACFRQLYSNELLLLYLSSYCTPSADYTVPLCLHACTCFHLVHPAPLQRPNQVYVITFQVSKCLKIPKLWELKIILPQPYDLEWEQEKIPTETPWYERWCLYFHDHTLMTMCLLDAFKPLI